MHVRWRRGLSGATTPERLILIGAEQTAKELAFGEAYEERCRDLGSILVDAHDLAVRGASLEWCRYQRHLYIIVTVYHRSAGRVRVFNWRKRVPSSDD